MSAAPPVESDVVVLRTTVRPEDEGIVRDIVTSTGFFAHYEVDVAVELVQEHLSRGAQSGYLFLFADVDDRTLAYACYGEIACTLGSYDLFWIVTHDAHRRRGLGRLLLREVERRVADAGGRRLYVETSSRPLYEPTHRFYESSGYREEARLEDFYSPGDAKVIFSRTLR